MDDDIFQEEQPVEEEPVEEKPTTYSVWKRGGGIVLIGADSCRICKDGTLRLYRTSYEEQSVPGTLLRSAHVETAVQEELVAAFAGGEWEFFSVVVDSDYGIQNP